MFTFVAYERNMDRGSTMYQAHYCLNGWDLYLAYEQVLANADFQDPENQYVGSNF